MTKECLQYVIFLALSWPLTVMAQPPVRMDGEFSDWENLDAEVATDPIGDATGAFDLSRVSAVMDGTLLYLRFEMQEKINLPNGPQSDGTLKLHLQSASGRNLTVDFRNRQAMVHAGDSTDAVPWNDLRFATLPTFAATDFELQLDLAVLAARAGDKLTLNFQGSDQLALPIVLPIGTSNSHPIAEADLASPAGSFRVASLNTLKQGSASVERSPAIKELFEFADADVYCFNEALEEDTFRATCRDVLPTRFARSKQVHWSATCGIVSRFPLTPLPFECQEAAALIDLPGENDLVVVSVHFNCCGFTGSKEDRRRIEEVRLLLADLQRLRGGAYGRDAAHAGVIVLGDFNLVGSRTPLDLINEAGLKDLMLRCPVDGSAMTWRGISAEESFWPGRLDYVTVDTKKLKPTGGFILNTEQLAQLKRKDSPGELASDHSMIVVDLKPQ